MKSSAKPSMSRLAFVGVFLLFAIAPLSYALYTDNRWEDFYITFRVSKNLALGNGPVYNVGDRLCASTSPAGTLVPALCSWLAGPDRDDTALWLFRIISIAALGLAGMLTYTVLQTRKIRPLAAWTLLILMAIDAKTVMFSVNGMETAFMILALSLSFFALTVETGRTWLWLGLAWSWAMWSRPDGFVYAGALALAILAFQAGLATEKGRGWLFRQYLQAIALAAVTYLPCFASAWIYYGTPIPHTIVAKGLHQGLAALLADVNYDLLMVTHVTKLFGPIYTNFPGWSATINNWFYVLWILAALPLVLPGMSRLTRALATAFVLTSFYLFFIVPFPYPWYLPNSAWMGFLSLGFGFHDFASSPKAPPRNDLLSGWRWPRVCAGSAVMAILIQLYVLGCVFEQMHHQQRLIEYGQRKKIGLWLKQNAETPHDTVFLECMGYIGYYSNLKMYDYPGLSSREVVEARERLNTDMWLDLIEYLHPDWLVLRPSEVGLMELNSQYIPREYDMVEVFDASKDVSALNIHGRGFLEYDQMFAVFHRKKELQAAK